MSRDKPIRTWDKGNLRYSVYHKADENADINSFSQDYSDCTPEERKLYREQDRKRLESLERGEWWMLQIGVEITCRTAMAWSQPAIVGRAYLSGVESDSDKSHFDEVERELVDEAEIDFSHLKSALRTDTEVLISAATLIPCDCPVKRSGTRTKRICQGTCVNAKIIAQATARELTRVAS